MPLSTLEGTVILHITEADGTKTFQVPDPNELPRELPISPAKRQALRFIRENLEPCTTSSNNTDASEAIGGDLSNNLATRQENDEIQIHETPTSAMDVYPHEISSSIQPDEDHAYRLPAEFCQGTVGRCLQKVSNVLEIGKSGEKRAYRFRERNQITKRSPSKLRKKKLAKALRSGNPFAKGNWKCCSRYQCFKRIGSYRCFKEYKEVNLMNPTQAKRYLISLYNQSEKKFYLEGSPVCARFLSRALGFSNDIQCAVKNTPKARGNPIALSRPREVRGSTKRVFIATFIRQLAKLFGDAMPHKEQITLPVLSRKSLWLECKEAWKNQHVNNLDEDISMSYFNRVWRTYADFAKICRNHGFTVCSRCETLRSLMSKHLKDEETLITLIDQHAAHLKFIERERNAYEERQTLAEQNPGRYYSIIIDGADQKNYGLPHFAKQTKSDRGHKLKVKVIGVLEHVLRGQEWLSLFSMTEEYETGANHIIEVAHRTFQRKKEKFGMLPPTLFVQVDNCIRENKNRYFMAYLQSLVHLGVFKTIQISFLPIGHTHTDIDQTFSSISTHLSLNDAVTMQDLLAELGKCYSRRVTTSEIDGVANYSGLCDQSGCLNDVDTFSEYRYFRFVRKDSGNVTGLHSSECDVKVQDSDAWIPFPTSRAEGFLKFVPSFGQTPATATKPLFNMSEVTKCLDAADERIQDDIKMNILREMQEKVYETRRESFHWNIEQCFELNGDYTEACSGDEVVQNTCNPHVEDELRVNYGYDPDDFVAVVANRDENTQFWIGRVKKIAEVDEKGQAKKITIRWYMASGNDPWKAKYTPAWKTVDGEQTVYEDDIDVATVLVRFETLTTAKQLRVRDKKAIKQTLDKN